MCLSVILYLCLMSRNLAAIILIILSGVLTKAQVSYLGRQDLLNKVDSCLTHTYNFSFGKAHQFQKELLSDTPKHPAPYFLNALIVYWENFPLLPKDENADRFVKLMDRTIDLAKDYMESEQTHLEGVFFDLYGRAFKAMFWADNGKTGKVIPDLRIMFKHTKEGFELKEDFNEFFFSTGLYNYYIEAYPEAHPVYKPVVSFMQEGDKKLGLQQLNHAINHSVFLRVESMLFMSLIQLKYEEDLNTSAIYAERLFRQYPNNIYYQGHLVTVLLYQRRFTKVREVIKSMENQDGPYTEMIRTMASAFITEKETNNHKLAGRQYQNTIKLANSFGPFTNQFAAIAYMGLSRLNSQKGLFSEAKKNARKADNLTTYRFILDD